MRRARWCSRRTLLPDWARVGWLLSLLVGACGPGSGTTPPDHGAEGVVWPAEWRAGRIFLAAEAPSGDSLTLYTDTGGGTWVFRDALRALPGPDTSQAQLQFATRRGSVVTRDSLSVFVFDCRPSCGEGGEDFSGMLGEAFFAGRRWEFDYRRRRLTSWGQPSDRPSGGVTLLQRRGPDGVPVNGFAGLWVRLDGVERPLLFDTGAMARLSTAAVHRSGLIGNGLVGVSFLTTSLIDTLIAGHPEWPVVENADADLAGLRALRVPGVRIGRTDLGPVWFIERPDRGFVEFLAQWTERPFVGALGGNALRERRVKVDYQAGWLHVD